MTSHQEKMRILLEYCDRVGNQEAAEKFAMEIVLNAPKENPETIVLGLNMALIATLETIIHKVDAHFTGNS